MIPVCLTYKKAPAAFTTFKQYSDEGTTDFFTHRWLPLMKGCQSDHTQKLWKKEESEYRVLSLAYILHTLVAYYQKTSVTELQ